jgi:hypothetical protein
MSEPHFPSVANLADRAAHDLADTESRLKTTLAGVDARVVFANYALYRLSTAQSRPSEHARPMPAGVEHAAWLLYPEFGKGTAYDGARVQEVIDAIEAHGTALNYTEMFSRTAGEDDNHLLAHLRLHSGIVRGSAYLQQIVRRIEMLLKPFDAEMTARVGIGASRAVEILRALGTATERAINRGRDEFGAAATRHKDLARKKRLTDDEESELIELALRLRQIVDKMGGGWVPSKSDIIAAVGELPDREWCALRDLIGLTPVSRAALPSIVEVQDRPLFFLDEEHAFYVHGGECFDAVFNVFDEIARNDPALRDRYGDCVAYWMEEEIASYMLRLFPAANIVRNACFPDPDNPGGETEADVVVVWSPFLIIAEAKGKKVPREALRGSRAKLRNALSANVQDAFYQARRVVRILDRDGKIRFKERHTGRCVEIVRERLHRVMPISVTLQHLSGVPTQLAITQKLGLFKGNAYPWSVSIDDLDVITRFADSPDVFLHYIERRTAHQHIEISVSGDELDIFGHYLDNRLDPGIYEERPEIKEYQGPRLISFDGGEERFEPFYVAQWYGRPLPKDRPRLQVPSQIAAILDELRSRTDDGARWIAFAILGLRTPALAKLNAAIRDLRKVPVTGSQLPRATAKEGDILINVIVHDGLDETTFRENVFFRTRLEQYATKAKASVTIGINQRDSEKAFDIALWSEAIWKRDEMMEQLVAADRARPRTMQLFRRGTKPGRNSPCPCGSGKKLKYCCIDRITFKRGSALGT